ncbi:BAG family molecular chaperone regulator 5 like [Actinidia chinensis var. chinensis]|uniref:BAG family molecular chaperone regulator 5 like n=1 Tax=Actinidia chinensis var. chinensis TaxID=1590841 RepID=A0A2R6QLX5_ACTCC|nr:BAG family molecular chaperone regulator 5 like [Actinidia chinensis var. chinensis]
MKSGRRVPFYSSFTSSVTYTFQNDHSTPHPQTKTTEIPIIDYDSPPVPIPVHLPHCESAAATKIQSAYRSHVVRTLVKKISSVNSEATRLERLIQRQETVDAIRTDDRERIRMNEALMGLLLRLDAVPGVYPTVRELRRRVSRRIVGLQEILDCVSDARVHDWDAFWGNWDDVLGKIEEDVCRERGGHEMEMFCAENLGLRCLQRFLRDQW